MIHLELHGSLSNKALSGKDMWGNMTTDEKTYVLAFIKGRNIFQN